MHQEMSMSISMLSKARFELNVCQNTLGETMNEDGKVYTIIVTVATLLYDS